MMSTITGLVVACSLMAQGSPRPFWHNPFGMPYPNDLRKWVVSEPPSGKGVCFSGYDHIRFSVVLKSGQASATLLSQANRRATPMPFKIERGSVAEGLAGRMIGAEVDDGWLVGFDSYGDGAGLWWFSKDGQARYRISQRHRINGFLPTDSGVVACTLDSREPGDHGGLVRLARDADGRWSIKDYLPLYQDVFCVVQELDRTFLAVTSHRLIRINLASRQRDVLVEDAFWTHFEPNSIVAAPDGSIYIGMKYGVAKVDKPKGKAILVRWLEPIERFSQDWTPSGFR